MPEVPGPGSEALKPPSSAVRAGPDVPGSPELSNRELAETEILPPQPAKILHDVSSEAVMGAGENPVRHALDAATVESLNNLPFQERRKAILRLPEEQQLAAVAETMRIEGGAIGDAGGGNNGRGLIVLPDGRIIYPEWWDEEEKAVPLQRPAEGGDRSRGGRGGRNEPPRSNDVALGNEGEQEDEGEPQEDIVAPGGSAEPVTATVIPGGLEIPPPAPPAGRERYRIPEEPRNPEWGPEFEAQGIAIKRQIIRLEALPYEVTYADGGVEVNGYVEQLKEWVTRKGIKSYTREPFKEPTRESIEASQRAEAEANQARAEAEARVAETRRASERAEQEQQDLKGLPAMGDLFNDYNALRRKKDGSDPPLTDEQRGIRIKEVEEQLSRYFKEAKRQGLLDSVEEGLRMMYVDIMRGKYPPEGGRKMSEPEIWNTIRESQKGASDLGKTVFEAKARREWQRADEFEKLEGVWDVYLQRTIDDRFSLLIEGGGGVIAEATIEGEFEFGTESLEQLNRYATDDTLLRKLLPDDEHLHERALEAFEGDDELVAQEFERLVQRREETFRRAKRDMEGAGARQAADVERYRQMSEERTLFWRPTYANYFEVYAKTPEQFQTVIDTFTVWIRSGVSKSPPELFQRVKGMVDALTTAGQREGLNDLVTGLKEELEGMIGILGGSFSIERYNPAYFKQFMDSVAQDTGPSRFLRVGKANRGKVAATLWKFDKDPRMEVAFASHLRRSQLLDDRSPLEQQEIQDEVINMLIFEMMGVEIKPYDPQDSQKRLYDEFLDKAAATRKDPLKVNMDELMKFKPDKEFKELFDGFEPDDQKRLLESLGYSLDELLRFRQLSRRVKQGLDHDTLESSDQALLVKMEDKGVDQLKQAEFQYIERLLRAERMQELYLKGGFDADVLTGIDKRMYEEAKNAVTLAYELYGVMGEKAMRGGAVVRVERWVDGKKIVDAVPMHWIEKFAHFAENWVRATYGGELDPEIEEKLSKEKGRPVRGIPAAELKYRVDQARRMAIWAVKTHGFDAKLFDFTLLRDGKPIDPNTLGYSIYGQDESKDEHNETDPEQRIDRYRYAPPENPRVIGFTKSGKPVTINFHPDGRLVTTLFDINGKPYELDKEGDNIVVYDRDDGDGEKITFDNLTINTRADPMLLKRPVEVILPGSDDPVIAKSDSIVGYDRAGQPISLRFDTEGKPLVQFDREGAVIYDKPDGNDRKRVRIKLYRNTRAKVDTESGVIVEEVPVDFHIGTHHIYSRWTGNPYWGYQEEDTELFKKARNGSLRIKRGISTPDRESPHASQVLIADATCERSGALPYEDMEDFINLAAVEESYQGHWRITDEIHQMFYPADADRQFNRIAYNLQDFGGSMKMWLAGRALGMRWTDALIRRARTMLPELPFHFASMSEMLGAPTGALDSLRMMGFGQYRMVGQFALEKWINQTEAMQDVFEAEYGWASPQEKRDREGRGEKPTDNADVVLQPWAPKITILRGNESEEVGLAEEDDIKFMDDVRKSRGRKETEMFRIRVLETTKRGEKAPQWLEGIDVWEREGDGGIKFDGDGQKVFNWRVEKRRDSGSSRHSGAIFFWRDVRWLRSDRPGEGQVLYNNVARFYELMDLPQMASKRMILEGRIENLANQSRWHQELAKENR